MRAAIFLAALSLTLSAQETMIRQVYDPKTDTHVEVTALFSQPPGNGFFPVRVKIANNLQNARSIQLRFRCRANYDDKLQTRSTFGFTAEAGKTVTRDILVPLSPTQASYMSYPNVTVELGGSLGSAENTIRNEIAPDMPSVLMSEALFTPNASSLDAQRRKGPASSYYTHSSTTFAAKCDPKQLPSEWQAFSGYDSVLLTDTDWTQMPASSRNALISWMNLGGQLVIHSPTSAGAASLGIPADPGLGSFSIRSIGSDLKLEPEATLKLVDSGNPVRVRQAANRSDYNTAWALQTRFGSIAFRYGLFIAVLVIFGILVGPVNLFVFAKSGRRHRLFVTTPLISLAASMVLIALIIFQDGFGGHGMRRVLMEVRPDAGRNAAFLHQEQVSRTGILLGSRFTVDPLCYLVPVAIPRSQWARFTENDATGSFNLQPRDGKMDADGDWWQSRSEHGHALSAVIPTRGRIERTAKPDEFVSTFDFPIRKLYYLDQSGKWHRGEAIETGKPFQLTPVEAAMVEPELAGEGNAFTLRNRLMFERAKNRPDHFIAITDQAPGIDTFAGIRWKETRGVVTGPVVSP